MKIEPRRLPLAQEAEQQEDTTPEFETGTGSRAHRRITVTVERETVSILTRRQVIPVAAQPAGEEPAPEPSDETLPAATPAAQNEPSGGKPRCLSEISMQSRQHPRYPAQPELQPPSQPRREPK